jgi:L-ascorbate metabolism protein UlaG (beta-lactamase superfamily)
MTLSACPIRLSSQPSPAPGLPFLPLQPGQAALWWLGQAGFWLRLPRLNVLIDPYLSDSLACKYAGTLFPHTRIMPVPLPPDQTCPIDWVLCTHRHTDHMDPETLRVLAQANPQCQFLMPRAERDHVLTLGLPVERIEWISDCEMIELAGHFTITAVASAHEEIKKNGSGDSYFLGYVIETQGATIYHSGDCVPYPGLAEYLAALKIDAALLPINGRDAFRASHGVPGNFTLAEALELCRAAGIHWMLGHHFGMFDFNTVNSRACRLEIAAAGLSERCFPVELHTMYLLES